MGGSFSPSLSGLNIARERRTGRMLMAKTLLTRAMVEVKEMLEYLLGFTSCVQGPACGSVGC